MPAAQTGPSGQPSGRPHRVSRRRSRDAAQGATTIDSLFGPLPVVESRGTAWQYENKQLKAIRLRLGVSDGTFTEVLNESDVPANVEVVTSMTTGLEQRNTNQNQGNNPLMGPQRGSPDAVVRAAAAVEAVAVGAAARTPCLLSYLSRTSSRRTSSAR